MDSKTYKASRKRRMDKRHKRALDMLHTYGGGRLNDPHDMASNIVDAMTDLLHLARKHDAAADDVIWSARNHFECESRPDDIEQGEILAQA